MPETPEQEARRVIDAQLVAAGWVVQTLDQINLSAARGVAVREMQSEGGPADYVLFVDGKALGVLEAKKAGTTLSGVAEQSQRYTAAKKWIPQRWADPLPFTYESTGIETNFRDQRDPDSRSRPVFAFHTPEYLLELVRQPDTLRARLRRRPSHAGADRGAHHRREEFRLRDHALHPLLAASYPRVEVPRLPRETLLSQSARSGLRPSAGRATGSTRRSCHPAGHRPPPLYAGAGKSAPRLPEPCR
ncbi:MAG: hypothetical protein JNK37_02300 [Verrucomicrobiales bacterium]|nr:hypothetical protein [Verrucomicrobiales bacterium]